MDALAALADPTRRGIIEMLGEGERPAGAIVARFALSAPAISQHLKVLRQARLVQARVDGQRRIYSLDPAGLEEVEAWTRRMRAQWAFRLDALAAALSAEGDAQPARRKP